MRLFETIPAWLRCEERTEDGRPKTDPALCPLFPVFPSKEASSNTREPSSNTGEPFSNTGEAFSNTKEASSNTKEVNSNTKEASSNLKEVLRKYHAAFFTPKERFSGGFPHPI